MYISIEGVGAVQSALSRYTDELTEKITKGVALGGQIVEADAKAMCPVDTGELRQSITSQADGLTCEVGTNKEYAMYVEFGTCKMAAQPYLVPALVENEDKIIETIKAALS